MAGCGRSARPRRHPPCHKAAQRCTASKTPVSTHTPPYCPADNLPRTRTPPARATRCAAPTRSPNTQPQHPTTCRQHQHPARAYPQELTPPPCFVDISSQQLPIVRAPSTTTLCKHQHPTTEPPKRQPPHHGTPPPMLRRAVSPQCHHSPVHPLTCPQGRRIQDCQHSIAPASPP